MTGQESWSSRNMRTRDKLIADSLPQMFQVSISYFKNTYRTNEAMLLRSTVPYSIPKHLSNLIDVVFGITTFPATRPVIEMSKRSVQQFGPNVDPIVVKKTMHIGSFNGTGRADNIQVSVLDTMSAVIYILRFSLIGCCSILGAILLTQRSLSVLPILQLAQQRKC